MKCPVCGLELKKGKCPAENKLTKNQYIIWVEKEGKGNYTVYSTNSVFWRDFFRGE